MIGNEFVGVANGARRSFRGLSKVFRVESKNERIFEFVDMCMIITLALGCIDDVRMDA